MSDAPTTTTRNHALSPGTDILWYHVTEVLGHGGFGVTYLAFDRNLHQYVALKEYLPGDCAQRCVDGSVAPLTPTHNSTFRWGLERFVREGKTLARFDHPAIVRVLSVFETNATAYIVMRYVEGMPLHAHLQGGNTLSEAKLKHLLGPLLGGLQTIHETGFIHRDIKPANIFISALGYPVLLDFGSARQAMGAQAQHLTTMVSPGYAPFEQYYSSANAQGPWTDIYALGATLYRAVTGQTPVSAVDRSRTILDGEIDPMQPCIEVARGRYSARFLAAIDHALAFRDSDRPQSVAAWSEELGVAIVHENARSATGPVTRHGPVTPPSATESVHMPAEMVTRVAMRRMPLPRMFTYAAFATVAIAVTMASLKSSPEFILPPTAEAIATVTSEPLDPLVVALLEGAETNMKAMQYASPQGDNALEKYRAVLNIDVDNDSAAEGLTRLVDVFLAQCEALLLEHDIPGAREALKKVIAIDPQHVAIPALTEKLAVADQDPAAEVFDVDDRRLGATTR